MTQTHRPAASSVWPVLRVLFVLSPVLLPVLVVLAIIVVFLGAMVVGAFSEGFAAGCAALAALIGLPSLGLLWLSSALHVFGRKTVVSTRAPLISDTEARYRSGDFLHRDYEAERREWLRDSGE